MDKKNLRNYLRSKKKKQLNIDVSAEENLDDEKSSFLFNLVSLKKETVIDRKYRISSLSRNDSSLEISFFKEKKIIQDSADLFQSPFKHDIDFSYKNKKNSKITTKNSKIKNKIVNRNKNFSLHTLQDTRIKKNSKNNAKVNKTDNKIVEDYVEQCPIDWSEIENFELIVEKTFKESLKIDASIKCIKTVNEKIDFNVNSKENKPKNINTELKIIKNDEGLPEFEEKIFDDDDEIVNIKHSKIGKIGKDIKQNFNTKSEFTSSTLKEIPSPTLETVNSVKLKPKYGIITSTPNVSPTKFDHKIPYNHEYLVNLSLKSLNQSFDCSVLESTKAKLQNLINKNHNTENLISLKAEKLNDTVFKTHVFKNIFDKDYSALIENSSLSQKESNFSERRDLISKSPNEYSKNKIVLPISLASDYSKILCNSFSSNFENNKNEVNDIASISDEDIFSSCRFQKITCRKIPESKLKCKTNETVNESDFKYIQNSHLQNEKFYCDDFSPLQKSYNVNNSFEVKQYSSCCFKSYCEFVSLAHNLSNGISIESKAASKFSKVISKDCIDVSNQEGILENNPSIIVLTLCNQVTPINFMDVITSEKLLSMEKIGEGLYGEVFCFTSKEKIVYKIVPIEGDIIINGEQQKSFQEIMPEMLISLELSVLLQSSKNVSPNFIQVNRISCVSGIYPEKLLHCWDQYAEIKGTENDRPDCFPPNQLYIIFEFAYGGMDLESVKLKNIIEAKSIFQQVASALAVAEAAIEFEHRDLHWGNILIAPTAKKSINYVLQDDRFTLVTSGILVTIIDFTLSYLRKDGCTIFTNLSEDISLFTGEGDYQFDIYRLMKEHNGNNWDVFSPYSNVLWLHYLLEKLLRGKSYHNRKSQKSVRLQLQKWQNCILNYKSAIDFVMNSDFLNVVEKEASLNLLI